MADAGREDVFVDDIMFPASDGYALASDFPPEFRETLWKDDPDWLLAK